MTDQTPNRPVDTDTRKDVLNRDDHRCQVCGTTGETEGGPATLEVHHIDRNPEGIDEHAMPNLTTLCRSCHSWHHQQADPDDLDFTFCNEVKAILLPHDYEILRILDNHGPTTTGRITDALTVDLTMMAVRERLWILMGLDNLVEARHRQVVDQNPKTGAWGLATQISHSARGHIPENPERLIKRAEDERVRRALNSNCPREHVAAVMGVQPRTTYHKERRAVAYEFPLDRVLEDRGLHSVDLSQRLSDTIGPDATALPRDEPDNSKVIEEAAEAINVPYETDEQGACNTHRESQSSDDVRLKLIATLDNCGDNVNRIELLQNLSVLAEKGLIEQIPPASPSQTYRVTSSGWLSLAKKIRGTSKLAKFDWIERLD